MKLYIKNKFISLGGNSSVVDQTGKEVFTVKGKLISPTRKKFIYDAYGNLQYIVRNKYWKFFSTSSFVLDPNKNRIAKITDKFGDFKRVYYVEGGGDEYVLKGEWFKRNVDIVKNGEVIGTIRTAFDLFVDSFELEADDKNMPFLVALVVAIDNIRDKQRGKDKTFDFGF